MDSLLSSLVDSLIEEATGERTRLCYQCRKCSAGCPIAFAMDLPPHEVINMVRFGLSDEVLESSTIWLCASCETCSARCPNGIDIARVMDALRQMSLRSSRAKAQREIRAFHGSFLRGIWLTGRTNEPVLIAQYKASSGRLLDDIGLGIAMVRKGKIKPAIRYIKERRSLRRLFKESRRIRKVEAL